MKIAFVYDAIYPYVKGGAEKRIYDISRRLTAKGHEVHVFGMKFWKGHSVIKQEGITYHGVCRPLRLYGPGGRRSIISSLYFATRLLPPLLRERFDLIDCQNFPYFSCLAAKIVSRANKIPLVITWHEVWDDYWAQYLGRIRGGFGRRIERMTVKLADRIIAVSEQTREDLISIGADHKKIDVIPAGINLAEVKKAKPAKKKFDVLFVGRLIKEKNVHVLLRSLKSAGQGISCGIIGEGPEKKRLELLAGKLGANVEFLGFVEKHEEVLGYMKSSKVLVLPSAREGFGIVLVEANACGTPVITLDAPKNASKHLVENGRNGFVAGFAEFPARIAQLTSDRKLRRRMSAASRKMAEKYDWEFILPKVLGVYGKLI